MVRCIAIDDEPLALRQIKSYIERNDQLELVASCRSAIQAREILAKESIDLIFVDINMPDLNGIDFVRQLTTNQYIIFTTAHSEYALEGFKLNAIDYLLKPFTRDEFEKATQKVISLVDLVERCHAAESAVAQNEAESADNEVISVKADYKTQLVKVDKRQPLPKAHNRQRITLLYRAHGQSGMMKTYQSKGNIPQRGMPILPLRLQTPMKMCQFLNLKHPQALSSKAKKATQPLTWKSV